MGGTFEIKHIYLWVNFPLFFTVSYVAKLCKWLIKLQWQVLIFAPSIICVEMFMKQKGPTTIDVISTVHWAKLANWHFLNCLPGLNKVCSVQLKGFLFIQVLFVKSYPIHGLNWVERIENCPVDRKQLLEWRVVSKLPPSVMLISRPDNGEKSTKII